MNIPSGSRGHQLYHVVVRWSVSSVMFRSDLWSLSRLALFCARQMNAMADIICRNKIYRIEICRLPIRWCTDTGVRKWLFRRPPCRKCKRVINVAMLCGSYTLSRARCWLYIDKRCMFLHVIPTPRIMFLNMSQVLILNVTHALCVPGFCVAGVAGCALPPTRMTGRRSGCGRVVAVAPPSGCTRRACSAGWTRSSAATPRPESPAHNATPSTSSSSQNSVRQRYSPSF